MISKLLDPDVQAQEGISKAFRMMGGQWGHAGPAIDENLNKKKKGRRGNRFLLGG